MTETPVSQHPASVDAYIRHGWSLIPIPPGTKGPQTKGWNQRDAALRSQTALPPGYGIGLAHAYSGTMALDIDNWDRAVEELTTHGIDLTTLYNAPDAVIIDSGRQGHGKLLYAMPFGLALPSKKITRAGTTIYELRCATSNNLTVQDILPPSIHPDTRQPYRWAGNGHWTRLPTIPQALLDLWQSMLVTETAPVASAPSSMAWDEITRALGFIDPDCSREEWITCGMALHVHGSQIGELDNALGLWNAWSAEGKKYPGEREILTQWVSFRDTKSTRVTLGSLLHLAREEGYVRPMPDVSEMFPSTNPVEPTDFIADLEFPAPNIDMTLVPEVLRKRAAEISVHMGLDPLVPLFAGLAAVCGALDARTRLEVLPGFKVPPILWVMSIGEPGDKKTPGSSPMFKVLEEIEKEDRPRFARALQDFEVGEVRYAAAKKHLLDTAANPDSLLSNTPLPTLPNEPEKPVPCRITVNDITSQKLVRHAADRPRGLLCALDEMADWVKKISDPRSGENKSAWTVAYESRRYELDRVGTGTIIADNYAVSIFGNIQPSVLRGAIGQLSEDGLIQRFIPVPLRADQRRLGHPVPECMTSSAAYDQMIRVCYGLPAMTYRLSSGAHSMYREFQAWYEKRMQDERLLRSSETFVTAFGKIEGLVGRMALVWHCIETPYDTEVSETLMDRVIAFVRGYVIPAQRYVFDGESGKNKSMVQWMKDYVMTHCDEPVVTLAQVRRSARRVLDKLGGTPWAETQLIMIAMVPLEDARWVARMDDGTQEHRGMAQWAVNPLVLTRFKGYRASVLDAQARRLEEIYANNPKGTGASEVHRYKMLERKRTA
jgi:hypothetical protein